MGECLFLLIFLQGYETDLYFSRAASEETRRPLLPPQVEAQLRNRSPIAAHPNNPTHFQYPPTRRFSLANASNMAGGAPMIRLVVDGGSRGDSVNNNNGWNGGKECGCRDLVIAKKNPIPEMRRDDRKGTFCEGCEICHGIIMT